MSAVVFLSPDMMFSSSLVGACATLGIPFQAVPRQADLAQRASAECRLAIIDLSMDGLDLPSAVQTIRQKAPQAQIVAYGPHVDEARLAAAQEAGCDQVLARGQFHRNYVSLLRSIASEAS